MINSIYELISLCHSDLDEALKQYQSGHKNIWYECNKKDAGEIIKVCFSGAIDCPEYPPINCTYHDTKVKGIGIELARCVNNIIKYCEMNKININELMKKLNN